MKMATQGFSLLDYFKTIMVIFTLLVLASLGWNMNNMEKNLQQLAQIEAKTNLDKDRAFRLWATRHGGAYFIVNNETPPSPFMGIVKDRDVVTSSGKILTLYNPATMLRDIMRDYSKLYGIKTRITAKMYLNPANAPDAWESKALEKLIRGDKEFHEITLIEGKKYLRVMQPMYMEKGCMKCHAWTGLKVGELRGATDVAVPLEKYDLIQKENTTKLVITHLLLWLIGMGSIYILGRTLIRSERKNEEFQEELLIRKQALEQSGNAIFITDTKGVIEYANKACQLLNGYKIDELIGQTPRIVKSNLNAPSLYRDMWSTIQNGETWKGEFKNRKKNGTIYWCYETISPVIDTNGNTTHYIAVTEDIEERKMAEEHIKQLAQYDPLTNIPNRRNFHNHLDTIIIDAKEHNQQFGLIYIDLDRFKLVNDAMGHSVGDALLQELSERLVQVTEGNAFFARLGGDEFAIISNFTDSKKSLEALAQEVQNTIKKPFFLQGEDVFMTSSLGIALYPKDGSDASALIKSADMAMFGAKLNGKNTHLFFESIHDNFASETLFIENGLRKAVQKNELFLVYQPKWDAKEKRFLGLEVLVRWHSPTFGLMNPLRFISIAEESDLIIILGEWILKESLVTMMELSKTIGFVPHISVNLSPVQFRQQDLNRTIKELLIETNFPAKKLELEITEGALVTDPAQAIEKMNELCAIGVTFSIDDFGTGYSSISYLKKFPVSTLKIDRVFVTDIVNDPHNKAIIQAIITLAESFNIKTIAEGVETQEEVDILSALGCNAIQGFWHSRPINYDALEIYFKTLPH